MARPGDLHAERRGPARDGSRGVALNVRRPDVVTLRVADLERAIAFHDGVLGLPVKLRTERYAELQADTVLLALIETPPGDASARSDSPAIGWEVPDLDEAVAELARRGVAFDPEERATTASAAGRRRSFRDPDGHRLELVQLVPGEIRSSERTTGTTG